MIVSELSVKNWRNFQHLCVRVRERLFVVGANASGKSNFLDLFRFLRDIAAAEGGGLQKAVKDRGGVSKIRSLAARRDPTISIHVALADAADDGPTWRYELGIKQEPRGNRRVLVTHERVWHGSEQVLDRPDKNDAADPERLSQTFLEQINTNQAFREVAQFFEATTYLHLVPQLLRYADLIQGRTLERDPFGQGLLSRIAHTPEATRRRRLAKIEDALKIAVPQLQQLQFVRDDATGQPHLQALYSHWRPNAGLQQEDQFSDGTLRLIGFLWSLLDGDGLLLLEEPELSLNSGIVSQLAPIIHRMQRTRRRQVMISTHSEHLLADPGIDGREVLLLAPDSEGTDARLASDIDDLSRLLADGFSVGDLVPDRTRPANIDRIAAL
jgi:predicted ATPase